MKRTHQKLILCIALIFLFVFLAFSAHLTFIASKVNALPNSPISQCQSPEITNVIYTPDTPEWADNITINALITDPWGILDARIVYDADNDAYGGWNANFTMTHVSDDLYTYEILNSIWDPPAIGPAHGSYVNFTIYAKNGLGTWSHSEYYQFYMNDTVKPVAQILTLTNDSYVSGTVEINVTVFEEGSGLKAANLTILMGNDTILERFTTTNLNETFLWDVSSLADYNISDPATYFTVNFTAWDNAIPVGKDMVILENIRIDNLLLSWKLQKWGEAHRIDDRNKLRAFQLATPPRVRW